MARRDVKTLERYFRWEHLPQRLQPISMLFGAAFARLVTTHGVGDDGLRVALETELMRLGVSDETQAALAKMKIGLAGATVARVHPDKPLPESYLYDGGQLLLEAKDCAVRAVL